MSTEALVVRPDIVHTRRLPSIAVLGREEARRILTSPAFPLLAAYLTLILGVNFIAGGDENSGLTRRTALAEFTAYLALLLWGPMTFVATHLVATSARRSGNERLLSAMPVDRRRRDLSLCLGVLSGPVVLGLALAGVSAWLASGAEFTGDAADTSWSWLDIAQVPAIVLGAGVLAIVMARWLPFPGSLPVGFVALILFTGWLMSSGGGRALRPWFAPYVIIGWWSHGGWHTGASPVWHPVYLLALSALGICVIALRQPERRTGWLAAGAVAVAAVITAGLLQLPPLSA